jgi:hypothetical protein
MQMRRCASAAPLFVVALMSAPLSAQEAAQSGPASAPAGTAADPLPERPTAPSGATIKKARAAGFKAEVRNGRTMFCWQDPNTGTRFTTKKCVDETRLSFILQERQETRDRLKQGGTSRN